MNIIDRVVMTFNPIKGAKRVQARLAANTMMQFDAASRGRRTNGWQAPATSADAAGYGYRPRLRQLSRDMIRNRPYAARARDVVTTNVIGTGIKASVEMPDGGEDEAAATEAQAFLQSHLGTRAIDAAGVHALPGLQQQVMNTVFSDGEVLARQRLRNPAFNPNLPLQFQVQMLECDHLDETRTSWGQNEVIEGIEYGPTGRIEAYHLYDRHPGDTSWWRGRSLKSTRVPAGQILHVRRSDRPGQMRGTPWLAPVMLTLGELGDYQEAEILKQKVASLLSYFVTSDDDTPAYDGTPLRELAPGAVVGLKPGQDVVPSEPPSNSGYSDFMRQGIWTIAMGIGITGESLSGDLRGANFSSGRMGRMEMDRLIEAWQQIMMIDQFCSGIGNWTLDMWRLEARRSTAVPRPPRAIKWTAPRRPLIDPSKEIKAARESVDAGITSLQRTQRQFGNDPDEIAKERREDARRANTPATVEG